MNAQIRNFDLYLTINFLSILIMGSIHIEKIIVILVNSTRKKTL